MSKADYCVFIGRFQPVHFGHLEVINRGLEAAEKVIVVVGSYRTLKTAHNPWSYEQRLEMLKAAIPESQHDRVIFTKVRDFKYANPTWEAAVESAVAAIVPNGSSVSLIGHMKDSSSFYQDMFSRWDKIRVSNHANIDATAIRKELFETGGFSPCLTPPEVCMILGAYSKTDEYYTLVEEYNFLIGYKKAWDSAPFPPTFVTTDAVVVYNGHVLMVKRGRSPGKGAYALPGGFLNSGEYILDGCLRELKEETSMLVPEVELRASLKDVQVFDHPDRDRRGRTITHAHYFDISGFGLLPTVECGDDAAAVEWVSIASLPLIEHQIYSDHIHIINYFVNKG